ncbi:MAG: hypothetical protein ACI9MJ_000151 [Alphaproteobacteria bacterium]|jgi:hypothetical protein
MSKEHKTRSKQTPAVPDVAPSQDETPKSAEKQKEFGGRGGLDPTRFDDWEKNGRCVDF